MLTDRQLDELCVKMKIPIERICFKDKLSQQPLKYNRAYIINLEDMKDELGEQNDGSHWTAFQVQKTKNGKLLPMYFDSYGMPPPKDVIDFIGQYVPYSKIDIQSLMADYCGYACAAWLHYINAFHERTGDIYIDTGHFLEMFDDLNESCDFKKNEYIIKLFFQSEELALRKEIDVGLGADIDEISKDDRNIVISTPLGEKFV